MRIFVALWSEFKGICAGKGAFMQYTTQSKGDYDIYDVFFVDGNTVWFHEVMKEATAPADSDQEDFEDNYKATCNKAITPKSADGKSLVIAVSRPTRYQTSFTTRCDDLVNDIVGEGNEIWWDFSNSDDEVTAPTGYKRKRIELQWIDPIYIKEGTIYFYNAVKGSYFHLYIVCPDGQYYLDNAGTPQLATEDTPFACYINKHFIQGDCPMGDELNTETATEDPLPTNYKIWVEITVPDSDTTSNGYGELELYRARTMTI